MQASLALRSRKRPTYALFSNYCSLANSSMPNEVAVMEKPLVSFIIPLYNEEELFEILVQRLRAFSESLHITHEFVLIDDGSVDSTAALLRVLALTDDRFQGIFLSRNFGHQHAVTAGLVYANAQEAVMILDGDLQDPPELFTEFYALLKAGNDVVYGVRRKRKESIFKRTGYHVFYRILARISQTPVFADSGDFALLSRRVVDIINQMPEDSRFLRGMRGWIGFKQIGLEYERASRAAGEPKYTLKKLMKLAYDGIFNFSYFPIKLLTFSGAICITAALLYLFIVIIRMIVLDDVPVGFTALLFMIIFFGGVQLISIGIIGEYVFRTFLQVKNRPLFIIKERIDHRKKIENE